MLTMFLPAAWRSLEKDGRVSGVLCSLGVDGYLRLNF